MAGGVGLSEQLRDISDPRPVEFHPDTEDWNLLSRAKLSQSRTYNDEGESRPIKKRGVSSRRTNRTKRLLEVCESDSRYAGTPISRKQLYEYDNEEVELESDSDQSDYELESCDKQSDIITDDSQSEEQEEDNVVVSEREKTPPREVENKDMEKKTEFIALAMDKVQEDIDKAKSVKEQIRMWDGLLEGRIKLHKTLSLTNRLPQTSVMETFMSAGRDKAITSRDNVQNELEILLDSLLQLQQSLIVRHRDTHHLIDHRDNANPPVTQDDSSDEDIPSDSEIDEAEKDEEKRGGKWQKRKRSKRKCPWKENGDYEDYISTIHDNFTDYRDKTIAKWDTKLRIASGKLTNKSFIQLDKSTLAQIKHVLKDKGRLVKRSQLKRTVYRVLGKKDDDVIEESHDNHLKSHDQEIYDEDDFYHQLLRDLIERKMNYADPADPVAMGRQWLALQKLRSKVKKNVDTKASKGRKIRYDVHPKLVGFMAPVEKGDMSHASRNDLFLSLFGAQHTQQH